MGVGGLRAAVARDPYRFNVAIPRVYTPKRFQCILYVMQISVRRYFAFVVLILALGALGGRLYTLLGDRVQDEGATGPAFPRYTVDADGSVVKRLTVLPVSTIARIPSRQLRTILFGINPVLIDATAPDIQNFQRISFSVENKPSDIFKEYEEYFTAIGWNYTVQSGLRSLMIRRSGIQTTITVAPRTPAGSLVVITRKTLTNTP